MTLYSLLAVLVLATLVGVLAVGLPFALLRNMARGEQYRRDLGEEVHRLRLSKMLEYLGIDRGRYLHRERVVTIHRHMGRCAACEATEVCDQIIETPGREGADIGFCPNAESLTKLPKDGPPRAPASPA